MIRLPVTRLPLRVVFSAIVATILVAPHWDWWVGAFFVGFVSTLDTDRAKEPEG
jgi:hypothetical protein